MIFSDVKAKDVLSFLIVSYTLVKCVFYNVIPGMVIFQVLILCLGFLLIIYGGYKMTAMRFFMFISYIIMLIITPDVKLFFMVSFGVICISMINIFDVRFFFNKNFLIVIAFIVVIVNIISILLLQNNRISYSGNNANFSAFVMLLFFMLYNKLDYKKLSIIFLFFGLLTLSRMFILGVILFFILENKKFFSKTNPMFVFFSLNGMYLFIMIVVLLPLFSGDYTNISSSGRIFDFLDQSNFGRISSYWQLFVNMKTDFYQYLYFSTNSEQDVASSLFTPGVGSVLPHNTLLYFITRYGIIFSVFYFIVVFNEIKTKITVNNYSFCFVAIFCSMFLHSLFSGYYLLFIMMSLIAINGNMNNKKREEYNGY